MILILFFCLFFSNLTICSWELLTVRSLRQVAVHVERERQNIVGEHCKDDFLTLFDIDETLVVRRGKPAHVRATLFEQQTTIDAFWKIRRAPCHVGCLTSRSSRSLVRYVTVDDLTLNSLIVSSRLYENIFGREFRFGPISEENYEVKFESGYCYDQGIIYTNGFKKGPALKIFFNELRKRKATLPKHVWIVEDDDTQIGSIIETFQDEADLGESVFVGIAFHVFHLDPSAPHSDICEDLLQIEEAPMSPFAQPSDLLEELLQKKYVPMPIRQKSHECCVLL